MSGTSICPRDNNHGSGYDFTIVILVKNKRGAIEEVIKEIVSEGYSRELILVVDGQSTNDSQGATEKLNEVARAEGKTGSDSISEALTFTANIRRVDFSSRQTAWRRGSARSSTSTAA